MTRDNLRSLLMGIAIGAIVAAILFVVIGFLWNATVKRQPIELDRETGESAPHIDRSSAPESAHAPPLVAVNSKGALTPSRPTDVASTESRAERKRLRESVTLVCAVVDSSGDPVKAGAVVLAREGGDARRQTFSGGYSSFTDVTVGKWSVSAMGLGLKFTRVEVEVQGDVSPLIVTIAMEPDPRSVLVRIEGPDGKRLVETLPRLEANRLSGMLSVVPTLAALMPGEPMDELAGEELTCDKRVSVTQVQGLPRDGRGLPLESEFDGFIRTSVDRPWFLSLVVDRIVVDCQLVDPKATVVTFRIDPAQLMQRLARVRLRILDAVTGKPIPKASVSIGRMTMIYEGGYAVARSDVTGAVEVEGVSPGSNFLEIRAKDYAITTRCLESAARQTVDLGDVTMKRGVTLAGTVRSPDGKPVEAFLELIPQLGIVAGWPSNMSFPQMRTSNDGQFRLTDLSPGPYTLRVVPIQEFGANAMKVTVPDRGLEGMQVEVKEGKLVVLQRDEHRPEPIVLVVISSQGCHIIDALLGSETIAQELCLEPGRYTLQVHMKGGQVRETSLTVTTDPVRITVP